MHKAVSDVADGERQQSPIEFEPKIKMEPGGMVELYDIAKQWRLVFPQRWLDQILKACLKKLGRSLHDTEIVS